MIAAAVLVASAWVVRWMTQPPLIVENLATGQVRISPSFVEPAEVDRLITVYEDRVAETTNALDYRSLGTLYLEKARTTGDVSRYEAAAEAFRTAVELFPSDPQARVGLASAHYSLHDFDEARAEATLVYEATSRRDALAVMADANLALGNYDVARDQLDLLAEGADAGPALLVRQAEWARLDGRADDALANMRAATAMVEDDRNPRRRAWYLSFAGQIHLHLGDYREASDHAASALRADPTSPGVAVTAARVAAATGDTRRAIDLYERVVETNPDPTHLAELHDLYLAMGDEAAAADVESTIDTVATLSEASGVFDRSLALFLAEHAIDPERAVEIARAELDARQDVGAYDTLAWALHAVGDHDAAAEASREARALGTLDARFLYHGGMIARAQGDPQRAAELLESSLGLSPQFQPLQADRARRALAELG